MSEKLEHLTQIKIQKFKLSPPFNLLLLENQHTLHADMFSIERTLIKHHYFCIY